MNPRCPTPEDLVRLIDGELTENRAAAVRAHVDGCSACARDLAALRGLARDLGAPIAPRPDALARLMARIDDAPAPPRARSRWTLGVVAVVAAAAIAVVVPSVARRDEWTARGGGARPSLARDVGVAVYRAGARLEPIAGGADVTATTAYAVGTRNLGPAGAFVLVFARDAAGQLHWISPAWTDETTDPASAPLPRADREAAPASATVLEAPAPGPMRIFTVVTPRALHVSAVERLAPVTAEAIRAAWPDAVVDAIDVRVQGGAP